MDLFDIARIVVLQQRHQPAGGDLRRHTESPNAGDPDTARRELAECLPNLSAAFT